MTRGTIEFPTGADGDLTPHLRALHTPPGGDAYWAGLEARILARVGVADTTAWWDVVGGWTRTGLLAAGIAALVMGVVAVQGEQARVRAAYQVVLDESPSLPAPMAATAALPGAGERPMRDPLDY